MQIKQYIKCNRWETSGCQLQEEELHDAKPNSICDKSSRKDTIQHDMDDVSDVSGFCMGQSEWQVNIYQLD